MTTVPRAALRCSEWARAEGLDPIGSAGSYSGYLLIEVSMPWPRDVWEVPEIVALSELLAGRNLRVQAVAPDTGPPRVVAYVRPDPIAFNGFVRREALVESDLADAVQRVLAAPVDGAKVSSERELLVCTHGRRDVCCGSLGTSLFAGLSKSGGPDRVRRLRTSHTGGHRFAPTFVVLPEGTLWAFADEDLVDRVLHRRGDAAEVAGRYRGCAGLPGPQVQALEREVLCRVGWDLLDQRRKGETQPGGHTQLRIHRDGKDPEVWEGTVVPARSMPVPDCGRPIEEATKSEVEWAISDVRRV